MIMTRFSYHNIVLIFYNLPNHITRYRFRDELIISEDRMMDYVESYYNVKLDHLTKNKLLTEELKKKYDFYLYFSQSALKRENQADLDVLTKYSARSSFKSIKYISSNIVI